MCKMLPAAAPYLGQAVGSLIEVGRTDPPEELQQQVVACLAGLKLVCLDQALDDSLRSVDGLKSDVPQVSLLFATIVCSSCFMMIFKNSYPNLFPFVFKSDCFHHMIEEIDRAPTKSLCPFSSEIALQMKKQTTQNKTFSDSIKKTTTKTSVITAPQKTHRYTETHAPDGKLRRRTCWCSCRRIAPCCRRYSWAF
jgi:hypothetical protein